MTDAHRTTDPCNCPNGSYGVKHTAKCLADQLRRATTVAYNPKDCASLERALDRVCARVQPVIDAMDPRP